MMTLLQCSWQLLACFHLAVAKFQLHSIVNFHSCFFSVFMNWIHLHVHGFTVSLCLKWPCPSICFRSVAFIIQFFGQLLLLINFKFSAESLTSSSLLLSSMADSKEQHVGDLCHFPPSSLNFVAGSLTFPTRHSFQQTSSSSCSLAMDVERKWWSFGPSSRKLGSSGPSKNSMESSTSFHQTPSTGWKVKNPIPPTHQPTRWLTVGRQLANSQSTVIGSHLNLD